jgi:hypothetical protein
MTDDYDNGWVYVRYQSVVADERGRFVGIFGLVNVLGRGGRLSAEHEAFRREANAWYDSAYPDPGKADPGVYDGAVNPLAAAWFKVSAAGELLERVTPYLAILDEHGVGYERLESADPGRVIYEDEYQVVVVPR